MDVQFKKIISLFFAVLSICVCVICTSCSDMMPELTVVYPKIIYSYEQADATPDAVLSVYAEVGTDAARYSSMTVQHGASHLLWEIKPVTVLSDGRGKQYAGYSSMKMPEGEQFPDGLYTIILKDYAGNTVISNFTLEQGILEKMPEKASVNRKYIVFDSERTVIYVSADRNDTSDSPEELSIRFPKAEYLREYISDLSRKTVCILPEEPVRNNDE